MWEVRFRGGTASRCGREQMDEPASERSEVRPHLRGTHWHARSGWDHGRSLIAESPGSDGCLPFSSGLIVLITYRPSASYNQIGSRIKADGIPVGNNPTQVWPGKSSNIENRLPVTKGFDCPQTDKLRVGRVMTFKYRLAEQDTPRGTSRRDARPRYDSRRAPRARRRQVSQSSTLLPPGHSSWNCRYHGGGDELCNRNRR